MTELTNKEQCLELQHQIDELSAKFRVHYENVLKPLLPEMMVQQIESIVNAMEAKQAEEVKNIDYDEPSVLLAHQEALKTMQSMMIIYNIQ